MKRLVIFIMVFLLVGCRAASSPKDTVENKEAVPVIAQEEAAAVEEVASPEVKDIEESGQSEPQAPVEEVVSDEGPSAIEKLSFRERKAHPFNDLPSIKHPVYMTVDELAGLQLLISTEGRSVDQREVTLDLKDVSLLAIGLVDGRYAEYFPQEKTVTYNTQKPNTIKTQTVTSAPPQMQTRYYLLVTTTSVEKTGTIRETLHQTEIIPFKRYETAYTYQVWPEVDTQAVLKDQAGLLWQYSFDNDNLEESDVAIDYQITVTLKDTVLKESETPD